MNGDHPNGPNKAHHFDGLDSEGKKPAEERLKALKMMIREGDTSHLAGYLKQNRDVLGKADAQGMTALHVAVEEERVDISKMLLRKRAPTLLVNSDGDTPLHIACMKGNVEIVKLLIHYNSDASIRNKQNLRPSEVARNCKHNALSASLDRMLLEKRKGPRPTDAELYSTAPSDSSSFFASSPQVRVSIPNTHVLLPEMESLKQQLQAVKEELDKATRDRDSLRTKNAESAALNATQLVRIAQLEKPKKEPTPSSTNEAQQALQQRVAALEKECDRKKAELIDSEQLAEQRRLTAAAEQKAMQAEHLKCEEEAALHIEQLNSTISALTATLFKENNNLDDARSTITSLTTQLTEKQGESTSDEVVELRAVLEEQAIANRKADEEQLRIKAEMKATISKLDSAEVEVNRLSKAWDESNGEKERLAFENQQLLEKHKSVSENDSHLQKDLQEQRASHEVEVKGLREQASVAESSLRGALEEVQQLKEQVAKLKEEPAGREVVSEEQEAKTAKLQKELHTLVAEHTAAVADNEVLQKRVREMGMQRHRLPQQTTEIREATVSEDIRALQESRSLEQTTATAAEAEMTSLREAVNKKEREHKEHEERCKKLEDRIESANVALKVEKEQAAIERSRKADIQGQLAAAGEKINTMEAEISSLRQKLKPSSSDAGEAIIWKRKYEEALASADDNELEVKRSEEKVKLLEAEVTKARQNAAEAEKQLESTMRQMEKDSSDTKAQPKGQGEELREIESSKRQLESAVRRADKAEKELTDARTRVQQLEDAVHRMEKEMQGYKTKETTTTRVRTASEPVPRVPEGSPRRSLRMAEELGSAPQSRDAPRVEAAPKEYEGGQIEVSAKEDDERRQLMTSEWSTREDIQQQLNGEISDPSISLRAQSALQKLHRSQADGTVYEPHCGSDPVKIDTKTVPDVDLTTGKEHGLRVISTKTNPRLFYQEQCMLTAAKVNASFLQTLPNRPEELTGVGIAHNYIGKKGIRAVLDVVALCSNVTHLDLSDNKLENNAITWMVHMARSHHSLTSINLDTNLIAKSGGASLLSLLQDKPAITELTISSNPLLMSPMVRRIQQQVAFNKSLQSERGMADSNPG